MISVCTTTIGYIVQQIKPQEVQQKSNIKVT